MKTLRAFLFAAGVSAILAGCSGPTGPTGPQGIDGANGADGANGTNGVANITNEVFDVSVWTSNTTYYYADFTDGAITDPNNEEVSVYFSTNSSSGPWQAMPGNNLFNSGDQLTYSWTTNAIDFYYDFSSLSGVPADVYFNVLVIPPAIMKRHPGTNWKNSASIMGLPEVEAALHQTSLKK